MSFLSLTRPGGRSTTPRRISIEGWPWQSRSRNGRASAYKRVWELPDLAYDSGIRDDTGSLTTVGCAGGLRAHGEDRLGRDDGELSEDEVVWQLGEFGLRIVGGA